MANYPQRLLSLRSNALAYRVGSACTVVCWACIFLAIIVPNPAYLAPLVVVGVAAVVVGIGAIFLIPPPAAPVRRSRTASRPSYRRIGR